MTGKRVKICIAEDKSPVEVHRRTVEMLNLQRIRAFRGLSARCIGHVGDQTPRKRSGIIDRVTCRSANCEVIWQIPDHTVK